VGTVIDINAPEFINELKRALWNYRETATIDTSADQGPTLLAADDLADAADAVLDLLLDQNGLPPTLAALQALAEGTE
jgi:hypothetical protein